MPQPIACPGCLSQNKPDAVRCRVCGRRLRDAPVAEPTGPPVILQRVMSGEVFTARLGDAGRGGALVPGPVQVLEARDPEDHSDVLAEAVKRIRAKAAEDGQRFKPYAPSKARRPETADAKEEVVQSLHAAVRLFRERKFEDAIEHTLRAIARDDEDRRSWILLAEAYLRLGKPYKAAVGYLRALELDPKDEQGWLGLARVLRSIDDLPTAASVIDRATQVNPNHADAWSERGVILEALQNLSEAMRSFARVLEIRPDHALAAAKRQELEARGASPSAVAESARPERPGEDASATAPGPPESADAMPEGLLAEMDDVIGPEDAEAPVGTSAQEAPRPAAERPRPPPSERVRTFVDGLDETLEGGVPRGHVILIDGAPGPSGSSSTCPKGPSSSWTPGRPRASWASARTGSTGSGTGSHRSGTSAASTSS
jgi:Flp pilus assembly protein TadD